MYYDKLCDLGIKLTRHSGQEKTKCPQCSDGRKNKHDKPLSVNITAGDFKCHNCGWCGNVRTVERRRENKKYEKPPQHLLKSIQLKENVIEWFKTRGISKGTLDKFMIFAKSEWMPQTQQEENCICFPYFRDGEMVNIKFRDARKSFKMVKDAELIFFNLNSVGEKKYCIITEGEIDCMSAYEAGFGVEPIANDDGELINEEFSKWCVVSVPNGASKGNQRMEYLDNCSDWFLGFHEIIIATDGDEAGESLKDELIRRLGVERCKIISYPLEEVVPTKDGRKRRCKDFNEILQYLGKEVLINIINNADSIPIEGVYEVEDIFPQMLENFKKGIQLAPTTRFNETDEYFRWKKGDINLFTGYANWGKALDIETEIPTPDGIVKMKDIADGDYVFDENGEERMVLKAHDIMIGRPCYKITFSDNTEVICDEDHLWLTHTEASRLSEKNNQKRSRTRNGKNNQQHKRVLPKVRTTKEILNTLYNYRKNGPKHTNHSIDLAKPIILPDIDLGIHPYCLGAWLGDGVKWSATLTCNDEEIINLFNFYGIPTKKRKAKFMYGLGGGFINSLRFYGLIKNKHIPATYLRASISQRLDLLKGLMDTDGYIDENGTCEFTTIKKDFAGQVYELICSLGIKAYQYEGDAMLNGRFISKKYRISFKPRVCVFNLTRKAKRHTDKSKNNWRNIKSIVPVESRPVRCLTVDSPNKLYLCTKSFIPTHNTFYVLQMQLTKSIWDGWRWAVFSPENYPANDFYDDLVEMYVGKWLDKMNEQEYTDACKFIGDHIFYVYPEDSHDINSINEKFRYLVMKKGIDGVLVDPFNQLDHNQKAYQREDQYLSEVLKDIKRFALLNNIVYNIIAHPKNPTYQEGKMLPIVDMYDIHGGSMWGNKADQLVSYHRPRFHEDKNSTEVEIYVQKVKRKRTGGKQGHFPLRLNWTKKRYEEDGTNRTPCDPLLAQKEQSDFNPMNTQQKDMWLPYKDDNSEDIGF